IDIDLSKVEEVKFGNTTLRVIKTPGHSLGGVCFFEPESHTLFSGDTLFKGSIGRTDLPGGDYSQIMSSILTKIVPLGKDVTIYPGHGDHTTLSDELMYNPFITDVL
ncbi:MAG: MBL fold metallo-hydrolase, partial [Rikenellaceae bacterium]